MKREIIAEINPDLIVLEPSYMDEAIHGVCSRVGMEAVVYDVSKIIGLLQKHGNMGEEEAEEWFDYNIAGAYVGEHSPVFLVLGPQDLVAH